MKKLFSLLLASVITAVCVSFLGIIGFVGWAIACSNLVQPGARSDLFSLFGLMDLPNGLIWLGFAIMAVIGLVLCVKTLFNKE